MNKEEFLRILRDQLEGTMDPVMIAEHIRYYDQYITNEIYSGKSEEQVMEELGSPVFIAKTLEDVAESSNSYYQDDQQTYTDAKEYSNTETEGETLKEKAVRFLMKPGTLNWLVPVVMVLVLFIVFLVVGAAAAILFRYFAPIMLILLIVLLFNNSKKL